MPLDHRYTLERTQVMPERRNGEVFWCAAKAEPAVDGVVKLNDMVDIPIPVSKPSRDDAIAAAKKAFPFLPMFAWSYPLNKFEYVYSPPKREEFDHSTHTEADAGKAESHR